MMKEIRVRGKRGSHALRQVGKQCRDFTQLRPSRAKLDPTGLRSNRAFSRCGPVSLAWVGGRFSPCCRFRLRKRKDFRQSDSSPDTPYPRRHLEPLQDLSRFRIDSPHIALVTFPSSVPELVVDSGDPSDDAVGRDGAGNSPLLGVDLMNFRLRCCPTQSVPSGPREPRWSHPFLPQARRGERDTLRTVHLITKV